MIITHIYKTCRTCIELKFIVYYCKQSEREDHRTDDAFLGQIAKTGQADTNTRKDGRTQSGNKLFHLYAYYYLTVQK